MVRITVTLTELQATKLKALAKERQLKVSDTMRRILDGELPFEIEYKGVSQDDGHTNPKPVAIAR
jgi:hypothetical protein